MAKIKFSKKQLETINADISGITFELNEGTIRSGKTLADIFKLAKFYLNTPDENHLVTAYNQEQAFRIFMDGDGKGLMHIFQNSAQLKHDDHGDHLRLYLPNGDEKKIYYKGGGKANSVGAIRGVSLGSVAYTEFDLLNKEFIEETFRRTVAAAKRFHLAEQNPPAPNHPNLELLERFEKAGTYKFRHWTMNDNPILSAERKEEMRLELLSSDYLYKRDWLGQRVMPEGIIYSMFDQSKHMTNKIKGRVMETFFTTDAGQSDATTCAFWAVTFHEGQYYLYRMANYYHSGADTGVKAMSVYAREIKIFLEWCYNEWPEFPYWNYFFVDPAAKSLREELHLVGIDTDKADNNASDARRRGGGIETGIERVQNLFNNGQLYLYDVEGEYDHYNLIKELGMYVRNDNGTPIDRDNHGLDELRYGSNYFYNYYIK